MHAHRISAAHARRRLDQPAPVSDVIVSRRSRTRVGASGGRCGWLAVAVTRRAVVHVRRGSSARRVASSPSDVAPQQTLSFDTGFGTQLGQGGDQRSCLLKHFRGVGRKDPCARVHACRRGAGVAAALSERPSRDSFERPVEPAESREGRSLAQGVCPQVLQGPGQTRQEADQGIVGGPASSRRYSRHGEGRSQQCEALPRWLLAAAAQRCESRRRPPQRAPRTERAGNRC